jgi:hypothetical protein
MLGQLLRQHVMFPSATNEATSEIAWNSYSGPSFGSWTSQPSFGLPSRPVTSPRMMVASDESAANSKLAWCAQDRMTRLGAVIR